MPLSIAEQEARYDATRLSPLPAQSAPAAALAALLEGLDRHFESLPDTQIRVERVYHDLSRNGDICNDAAAGPPAYTAFVLGEDEAQAEISIQADGSYPDEVYLFGHDGVTIGVALQALQNLLALLNNPHVQAARNGRR